ncbi:MAG: hypothetical protein PHY93_20295 [Bacteriovorax sp.]|nr:hypothetical protein [Bacteriovorax sp.]
MEKTIFSILALLILTIFPSYACDIHGKTGFLPENNLKISEWDKATNGMTQERFLAIIKRVSDIYAPIVKSKGGELSMINKWSDDTVNALADRNGDIWIVEMFGGLARHPLMTDDGFALIVCHELAHHVGGAPNKPFTWAASEGQADYFGAMKCLRRVLEKDDNTMIVAKMTVDAEATKQCGLIYKNANELALCQRIAMVGKSLGNFIASFTPMHNLVALNTPAKNIVLTSLEEHPAAQCRLDTFFQGILCDKSYDQDIDNKDPIIGSCIARDGHKVGTRPLCWYKPGPNEI